MVYIRCCRALTCIGRYPQKNELRTSPFVVPSHPKSSYMLVPGIPPPVADPAGEGGGAEEDGAAATLMQTRRLYEVKQPKNRERHTG